jgi:hypothetical protein
MFYSDLHTVKFKFRCNSCAFGSRTEVKIRKTDSQGLRKMLLQDIEVTQVVSDSF